MSAKDDGTVDIRAQLGGEGRVVITSSSSTQYSFEQEGEELSLYTRFLVEGIKTGAADLDGDDMVSIDELHEYASRKVREVKPELKPELYAVREGFKIRLCKVPHGDPHERYKKEVTRCGKRGDLTIVSRSILDTWRVKLGLSIDEAKALEDEVLAPYRRDFQQKLKRYEETVEGVLQRDGLVNNTTRIELQRLQQVLELRQEDTVPIEAKAAALLKKHKQNLETYKQSFSDALRQEYPLGEANRDRLRQMQRQLMLNDGDVAQIEAQITTEVETYRGNLQQYEQAFLAATQEGYPLSESKSADLQQYQLRLDLSDVEVAPIEAKITAQIETYQEKLQQYKETFASATQRKHQPGQANTSQLMQTWKTLGLKEEDVQAIEAPIREQLQTYQANLRRYEQAFLDATDQEYPVSRAKHAELRQRQRSLSLSDEDIASIENRITASIEEHLKSLQQYEQVFSDSIQFEFPVSEATREELRRFQQILELGDRDVAQLEEKVVSQNGDHGQNQRQVEKLELLGNNQDVLSQKRLGSSLTNLGISNDEAETVDLRLTRDAQAPTTQERLSLEIHQDGEISQNHLQKHSLTRQNRKGTFWVVGTIVAILGVATLSHTPIFIANVNQNSSVAPKAPVSNGNDTLVPEKSIGTSYLGVYMRDLTPGLRKVINQRKEDFQVGQDTGVLVLEVHKNGPAFLAGMQQGDIIQKIDGETFITLEKALGKLNSTSIGQVLKIETKRGTNVRTLEVKLETMPNWLSLSNSASDKHNRSDYQGALQDYDQALSLNSEQFNYVGRGDTKVALNDNKGAIADYDQAIKRNVNFLDLSAAYLGRGSAKFNLGDLKGAITDYGEAIRLYPEDVAGYLNRGNAQYRLGNREEALADYKETIRINPSFSGAYVGRGNIKSDMGDKKGAIADYDEAIRLSPDNATAYANRANVRSSLEDKKGAIADYSEAIRLDRNYASAYFKRAVIKSELGDKQGATTDYKDASRIYWGKGETELYQKSIDSIEKIKQ